MKSDFEQRKEERIARLQSLARKNETLSESLYNKAKEMQSVIPMGQPILVGHHSEAKDRRYRNKIDNTFGKSFQASDKAKYYEDRAESLINGTAISSDDPKALDKLEEKMERLTALQELMKQCNKIIKSKKSSDIQKIESLVAMGLSEKSANQLLAPDFAGRIGFPSFRLTNNNANISRIRQRIEHLKKIESLPESEEVINGATLKVNPDENRVQVFFPEKPDEDTRKRLKVSGFHWSPTVGCWMRQISNSAIYNAKNILTSLKDTA